ncbi:MAG: DUF305 domain-containing protein [bacterium]
MPRLSPSCLALVAIAGVAACSSPKPATTKDTTAAAPPGASVPAVATEGTADRGFLRKLSDHHKGMIAMAHLTKDNKNKLSVKALAERIDSEQDAEIDKVVTLLEKDFKDPYTPKVSAPDQAMVDDLKAKTGAAYDRAFLEHTIAHHTEALGMIDAYLQVGTNPAAKALASTIRESINREVPEFTALLARSAK